MADNPKPKRRLKPAQTVRERAQKTKEEPKKQNKSSKIRAAIAWPGKTIAKPYRALSKKLNKYKLFRILGRIANFIGKILLPTYLRSSWKELKLVSWPNRRESRRLTYAVLAFSIVFGALVASLDYGLSHLFKIILLSKHP